MSPMILLLNEWSSTTYNVIMEYNNNFNRQHLNIAVCLSILQSELVGKCLFNEVKRFINI